MRRGASIPAASDVRSDGKMPSMSESTGTAFSSYRALLNRWTRAHTLGAICAVLALFLVLAMQVTALSGWHFARANESIPLTPSSPTVVAVNVGNTAPDAGETHIQYNFVGAPAVAATRTVNVATSQVLGVRLSFDQIPANVRLSIGWVGTHDRGKPTQLLVRLPESSTPASVYVPLRGHSEWRDSTTQLAVALAARPGTPSVSLQRAQFVSATPSGALWHAWGRWTERTSDIVPDAIGERVVPMAAWLALAALIAFSAVSWLARDNPVRRRDCLLGATALIACAIFASTILMPGALTSGVNTNFSAWALFALVCMGLIVENDTFGNKQILLLDPIEWFVAIVACITLAVGGLKFAWLPVVVVAALLARRFQALTTQWRAAIYAVPLIAVLAIAQAWVAGTISSPTYALVDPTSALLASMWRIGGFTASIATLILLYAFWPTTTVQARRGDLALALWLSLIAIVSWFAVVSISPPASVALPTAASLALWAGLAALCTGWLAPTALQPVSERRTEVVVARSEFDLSDAARQLFDAAAASVDSALASNRSGTAFAPLLRMKELAPTSLRTYLAELRYGLASGRASEAASAYAALKSQPVEQFDDGAIVALAAYAEQTDDFDALLQFASRLPQTDATARRVARAELLRADSRDEGITRALEVLQRIPEPNAFAHELTELHLLRDDWQTAQKSLAKSAFTPQSVIGSIYVARLGLRATNGSPQYIEQLQKLTTWHNKAGAAQLGMGETMLLQGNPSGARVRFLVARNIDATLWPIERRIRDIERSESNVSDRAADAELSQTVARLGASQPA
jgi:hypothetical protein